MQTATTQRRPPVSVWLVMIGMSLLVLEALMVTIDGILQLPELSPANRVATLVLTILSLGVVAWMISVVRGLWCGRRWTRASVVVASVLAIGAAVAALQPGAVNIAVACLIGLPALLALISILVPPSTRWVTQQHSS